MSLARIILGIAGLSLVSSLLASPTGLTQEKTMFAQIRLACTTSINVDPQNGVDQPDAYVCDNSTVTWIANNHTFCVFFKHDCPFAGPNGCKQIDDQHPTSGKVTPGKFKVYDYGIVVDGKVFDPHIIGGGS